MQLVLPPEIEAFVQRQVESGRYSSPLEVAITAFQRMQEQDEDIYQGRLSELQEDARIGLEAYERGEIVDGPTAMAQIRSNLHNRYQKASEAQEE
ncbi:MAG: type II toxin-antitoxin system ParD family antitoxin [Cyanobacteria bacterium J06627_28]